MNTDMLGGCIRDGGRDGRSVWRARARALHAPRREAHGMRVGERGELSWRCVRGGGDEDRGRAWASVS